MVISHPKLVETGLDLLDFPTIIFYESGYSLHTLRQASRRSWRIGQRRPVRVKFLCYEGTMQTACLRLMGKKLLVALPMEGKFAEKVCRTSTKTMTCFPPWRESGSRERDWRHRRCSVESAEWRTSETVPNDFRIQQRR